MLVHNKYYLIYDYSYKSYNDIKIVNIKVSIKIYIYTLIYDKGN